MSDKIVGIKGNKIAHNRTPNEDLIDLLEETLEKAKEGTLQSIAITGFTFDGCRLSAYIYKDGDNVWQMIGAIDELKAEYASENIEH